MKLKLIYAPLALLLLAGCGGKSEPKLTAPLTVESVPAANATPANAAPANEIAANAAEPEMDATANSALANSATTATDKPASYRVRGEVVEVTPANDGNDAALMVKHENIPGFMPAMQMRVPLADAGDAAKVKAGDKISFDMNADSTAVSNIEMLPASTALKLEN